MKKQSRHVTLSISLPQDLREQARQAAFDDNVSLSSFVAQILRSYLASEAYLNNESSPHSGLPFYPCQRIYPIECH